LPLLQGAPILGLVGTRKQAGLDHAAEVDEAVELGLFVDEVPEQAGAVVQVGDDDDLVDVGVVLQHDLAGFLGVDGDVVAVFLEVRDD
jgi:hypothetical protein